MDEIIPTPLDIARIDYAKKFHEDIRWLIRDDVHGLNVWADLYIHLKEWEEKLKEIEK